MCRALQGGGGGSEWPRGVGDGYHGRGADASRERAKAPPQPGCAKFGVVSSRSHLSCTARRDRDGSIAAAAADVRRAPVRRRGRAPVLRGVRAGDGSHRSLFSFEFSFAILLPCSAPLPAVVSRTHRPKPPTDARVAVAVGAELTVGARLGATAIVVMIVIVIVRSLFSSSASCLCPCP